MKMENKMNALKNKCKFCGCLNATEPISDEDGNAFNICVDCDFNAEWEMVK